MKKKATPTPPPPLTPEELERARQSTLLFLRQRVIDNAESAVSTLEQFLRTAKQRITEVKENPDAKDFTQEYRFLSLPESVLHEMAWGFANASGSIGSSISAAQDFLRVEKKGIHQCPASRTVLDEEPKKAACTGSNSCTNAATDDPHSCPYREDINGDSDTQCNCCSSCERECAMDV